MDEDEFHAMMAAATDASEVDDARARVVMGQLSERLMSDQSYDYGERVRRWRKGR